MQHCECGENVSLYLDGLLSQDQVRRMEEHLAQCDACRHEWEAMCWVSSMLKAEPLASPAPGFARRVLSRLQQREARRQRLSSSLGLLLGSAGLGIGVGGAFVVLFVLLWQPMLRVVLSSVILPLIARAVSFLSVMGRALYCVVRDLSTRPTGLLLCIYGLVALGLIALWTYVVVRPQTGFARLESELS